jgi:XTP/dITP diphosphohydrolase
MKKIFIASKNQGKVKEIKSILSGFNIEFFSLIDSPNIPDIEETGTTFEENAFIKAKAVYDKVQIPVLADDSGLEVDYLGGVPGVYSARYAGKNATDAQNCKKLLVELDGVESKNRTARFKCILVLYDGVSKRFFEGACEGNIITSPRGTGGFGYDPLFVPEGYEKTFAELDLSTKNKISHRGKALASLKKFLDLEFEVMQ